MVLPTLSLLFTAAVQFDADDPAFVYNSANPEKSILLGTDKEKAPGGGLFAFDLQGNVLASVSGLDRPNNVDTIELPLAGETVYLAVVTERLQNRLRIFAVSTERPMFRDFTGSTEVFSGETGEDKAPMGIACWSSQGKTYAFVTPKQGSISKHIEQLELRFNTLTQNVDAIPVRRFGWFSGRKETESIAVDRETGRVFYSDEGNGVWVYNADPNSEDRPIMLIRNPLHTGDHEGLAFLDGLLVSTDQRKDRSVYWFYDKRSGIPRGGFAADIDETDGMDIIDKPGAQWMAAMNSKGKNFALIPLSEVRKHVGRYP